MDIEKALEIYENIEASARNEILACGGSISHHHGIGKIRKRWLPTTIGNLEISLIKSLFEQIDPEELFKNENLFDESIQQNKEKEKSKL